MAGDIVASYGLDDKAIMSGLKSVEKSAESSARRTETLLSQAGKSYAKSLLGVGNLGAATLAALGTAGRLASSGMREFAKVNGEAAFQVAAVESAWSRMLESVGRGATQLGVGNFIADVIDGYVAVGQGLGDILTRELGIGGGREATDAIAAAEAAERQRAADERFRRARLQSDARYASAGGDSFGAGLAQAELSLLREIDNINASILSAEEKSELIGVAQMAYQRERARLSQDVADAAASEAEARRRAAEAAEREQRAWAEKRVDERRGLDESIEAFAIQNKRLAGLDKEADLAEATRDAEELKRRIAESSLSEGERAARIAEIEIMAAERIALIEAGKEEKIRQRSALSLEAGQVSAQSMRQVFGSGGQDRLVAHAAKTNALLTQIRDDGRRQSEGAVYAR